MNKKVLSAIAIIALIAVLGVCLVACNADSYTKKLEKAGYSVTSSTSDPDDKDAAIDFCVVGVKSTGLLSGESVTITKFKSSDDAKQNEADAKSSVGKLLYASVYRIGNIVIKGTEQGVKDAK